METLKHLFKNNREWAEDHLSLDPDFFKRLSKIQHPDYLWIGCSDSRVPANEIVGLQPGELFVHRNVANVVVHTDLNCLSVIEFAVKFLRIKDIIVCGHYGCGGVRAALDKKRYGLVDNWIRHIKDVADIHRRELVQLRSPQKQLHRLCELNVLEQVLHVCATSSVQEAWNRGQKLTVHGWIYDIQDGLLHDLGLRISSFEQSERTLKRGISL